MITNNFKKIICGIILNSGNNSGGNSTAYTKAETTLKNIEGTAKTVISNSTGYGSYPMQSAINAFNQFKSNITNTIQGIAVRVGTGNTEPTQGDYNLEAQTEEIAITAIAALPTQGGTKIYTVTFANNTQEDINIKEVGLFFTFNTDENNKDIFMLDRTAVDITIPAGETKTYNYEISFN